MRDSFFADDDMSPRTLAEACPDLCPPFQSNPPICKEPSPASKLSCDDKETCLQKNMPLMNIGEECKARFGCENGHCPSCGRVGMCCKKGVTGCGCSGRVGGETRYECTRDTDVQNEGKP